MPSPILEFFDYGHLPLRLQEVSKPFKHLAVKIDKKYRSSAEKTTALRKLLEAKDCAVRCAVKYHKDKSLKRGNDDGTRAEAS